MLNLKAKLRIVFNDLLIIAVLGIGGTAVILSIRIALGLAIKYGGESDMLRLSIKIYEFVHFSWSVMVLLFFVIDSLKGLVIILLSSSHNEEQN